MRIIAKQPFLGAAIIFVAALIVAGPSRAVEDQLLGVRIGASHRHLLDDGRFGQPDGILFPAGGALLFQTVAPSPTAGLPSFGQQTTAEAPVWVGPVRASTLNPLQLQWVYDFRKADGVALGVVFNTEGGDAVVTDLIVAGYPERLKGKAPPVRTQKGVVLGSTFADVLKRYGYPPLIEIYAPTTGVAGRAGAAGARPSGMRAGVRAGGAGGRGMRAGRGGGRRGDRGGMRGGPGRRGTLPGDLIEGPPPVTTTMTAQAPEFELVLTAMRRGGPRGGRGGARGGRGGPGFREGRGAGVRGGRGGARGGLPPLGTRAPAPGAAELLTAEAVVDHASIGFSRDCILTYEGVAFTLHDMKVYRIHVSE
ncbi:MAG: hypothetical protein JSV79_10120 [Armatimonadota bacterium]|nr:MAG: hypothetical protein JSV79_10120 [Armatimonadota bacterium]